MSTTIEINQEGLSALSISDLILMRKDYNEAMTYPMSSTEQKELAEKLVAVMLEFRKRESNLFTI